MYSRQNKQVRRILYTGRNAWRKTRKYETTIWIYGYKPRGKIEKPRGGIYL